VRQICPHCGYIRKAADSAPDWQCPSCSKAYVKSGRETPPASLRQLPSEATGVQRSKGRWLIFFMLLGAAMWFGRPYWQARSVQESARISASQPEVILYATDWCGYCRMAREFFSANGIRYTERDIEKSSLALSEHKKLGGRGVPLIVVGDELVGGYNEPALQRLLGPWINR